MWAHVVNGLVADVTNVDPSDRYHPDLVWLPCSEDTKPGWLFEQGKFQFDSQLHHADLIAMQRIWRDARLQATEWLVMRHRDELAMTISATLTAQQYSELLNYRQHLRDWPTSASFPDQSSAPAPPEWLALQTS